MRLIYLDIITINATNVNVDFPAMPICKSTSRKTTIRSFKSRKSRVRRCIDASSMVQGAKNCVLIVRSDGYI